MPTALAGPAEYAGTERVPNPTKAQHVQQNRTQEANTFNPGANGEEETQKLSIHNLARTIKDNS